MADEQIAKAGLIEPTTDQKPASELPPPSAKTPDEELLSIAKPREEAHHSLAEAKDWVRLHPSEEKYWSADYCFVHVPIKGQKRGSAVKRVSTPGILAERVDRNFSRPNAALDRRTTGDALFAKRSHSTLPLSARDQTS